MNTFFCYVSLKNLTFKHKLGQLFLTFSLTRTEMAFFFFTWSFPPSSRVHLSVVMVLKQSSLPLLITLAVPFPVWKGSFFREQGLSVLSFSQNLTSDKTNTCTGKNTSLNRTQLSCSYINERQESSIGNSYYCIFLIFLLTSYLFAFLGFVLQGAGIHYPAMEESELLYYSCF